MSGLGLAIGTSPAALIAAKSKPQDGSDTALRCASRTADVLPNLAADDTGAWLRLRINHVSRHDVVVATISGLGEVVGRARVHVPVCTISHSVSRSTLSHRLLVIARRRFWQPGMDALVVRRVCRSMRTPRSGAVLTLALNTARRHRAVDGYARNRRTVELMRLCARAMARQGASSLCGTCVGRLRHARASRPSSRTRRRLRSPLGPRSNAAARLHSRISAPLASAMCTQHRTRAELACSIPRVRRARPRIDVPLCHPLRTQKVTITTTPAPTFNACAPRNDAVQHDAVVDFGAVAIRWAAARNSEGIRWVSLRGWRHSPKKVNLFRRRWHDRSAMQSSRPLLVRGLAWRPRTDRAIHVTIHDAMRCNRF